MTEFKRLPDDASLDFARKQVKALVKAIKNSDPDALARARAQLGPFDKPLALRQAQLVVAREHGHKGWTEFKAAILKRAGRGMATVVQAARKAIDANDVDKLKQIIAEHPDLLTWRDSNRDGEVLLAATTSYANFPGPENEDYCNRRQCAEVLLDAGAITDPRVFLRLINTGAHHMLAMFNARGLLPRNLRVVAALGNLEKVRACFDSAGRLRDDARPDPELRTGYEGAADDWPEPHDDNLIVSDALLCACSLRHREVAAFLLNRCLALDPDLGRRVANWNGEQAFLDYLIARASEWQRGGFKLDYRNARPGIVWRRAVELRLMDALHAGDAVTFRDLLAAEPYVLESDSIGMQTRMLEVASYSPNGLPFIKAIIESGAAIVGADKPPRASAVSYAVEYGHADYVPLLSQIWAVPDDLPHAAGLGKKADVVKWFDEDGKPKLGHLSRHFPFLPKIEINDVLDRSLAWAVQNGEYDIADYLLERGADINTRWSTHEPASIMHECAKAGRIAQVKYLLSRGYDLTITDHRMHLTAESWARSSGQTEIADILAAAARNKK